MWQLFNDYADQAGYYDLCLLIYHIADFRNATTISATWGNLIRQTHDEVMAKLENEEFDIASVPMPYEVLSTRIQNIAHQTSLDSFVFPIQTLLPQLCRYAVAEKQGSEINADATWPVQLFLRLGVNHDMIIRVLENIFDTQDYGFSGNTRNRVIELIVYVVNDWLADVRRRGGAGKSGSIGPAVGELLARCETAMPAAGYGSNPGGGELADIRRTLRTLRRDIAGLIERVPTGSLRFM